MKLILVIATVTIISAPFFVFSQNLSHQVEVIAISVYDGDTFKTRLPSLPLPLAEVSVRILGIDTPELGFRAKCQQEQRLGLKAKKFLQKLLPTNSLVVLSNYQWDKYGGRILAEVTVNHINVGEELLKQHLAVPYLGQGPRHAWCAQQEML